MNQNERLLFLIQHLKNESIRYSAVQIPSSINEQFQLFRSLANIRLPEPVSEDFLKVQDAYLQEETARKGITDIARFTAVFQKYLSMERRYYHIEMRCNCQCCKFADAWLFSTVSWLH